MPSGVTWCIEVLSGEGVRGGDEMGGLPRDGPCSESWEDVGLGMVSKITANDVGIVSF